MVRWHLLRCLLSHWLNIETRHSIHSPFFSELYKNVVSAENQSVLVTLFQKSGGYNLRICNRVIEYLKVRSILIVGNEFPDRLHVSAVHDLKIVHYTADDLLNLKEIISATVNSNNYSLDSSTQHEVFDVMLWEFETAEIFDKNFLSNLIGLPGAPKVMIFLNIYQRKSSTTCWNKLKESYPVFASVDLFHCGILFLGKTKFTAPQHYVW